MTKEALKERLSQYVELKDEEAEYFLSLLSMHTIERKQKLLAPEQAVLGFHWVQSGCLMAYHTDSLGNQHVLQFAIESWWTTDLQSLFSEGVSSLSIEAMTDSSYLTISRIDLDGLMEKYPVFERYFRKIFQNALISNQRRILLNISKTADERYEDFQQRYPKVEQIVPQKYIASYLGITPEFLSKIRRKRATRS